jgi:hypothetical protein
MQSYREQTSVLQTTVHQFSAEKACSKGDNTNQIASSFVTLSTLSNVSIPFFGNFLITEKACTNELEIYICIPCLIQVTSFVSTADQGSYAKGKQQVSIYCILIITENIIIRNNKS